MKKNIPYIFEDAMLYQDLIPIHGIDKIGRTRVSCFYRGKNRNGSFITDEIADILIASATRGNTPIIGFYNYEEEDFERHMGPKLAKGYGYIPVDCNFAWEERLDKDGVVRSYACFDCILFCDYFEEAKEIIGKPQSMELNRDTIVGDWQEIDGEEYFVYSFAEMKGLCVLGSNVEPCFESASFFEKDANDSKFDKFSLLLSDLMEKVKEAEGGEKIMDEQNVNVEETALENFTEEQNEIQEIENEVQEISENIEEITNNFEQEYKELLERFNSVTEELESIRKLLKETEDNLDEMSLRKTELEDINTSLNNTISEKDKLISKYEIEVEKIEKEKKEQLISKYEKALSEEEINEIKPLIADFSYDELESKLAISFSRKNIGVINTEKIPTPEPELSDFEKLMAKYKK